MLPAKTCRIAGSVTRLPRRPEGSTHQHPAGWLLQHPGSGKVATCSAKRSVAERSRLGACQEFPVTNSNRL